MLLRKKKKSKTGAGRGKKKEWKGGVQYPPQENRTCRHQDGRCGGSRNKKGEVGSSRGVSYTVKPVKRKERRKKGKINGNGGKEGVCGEGGGQKCHQMVQEKKKGTEGKYGWGQGRGGLL